jgi:hypothetical protein
VRGGNTIVLIDRFAACMDFDLLSSRAILNFHIEVVDEIALQRIKPVFTCA